MHLLSRIGLVGMLIIMLVGIVWDLNEHPEPAFLLFVIWGLSAFLFVRAPQDD